MSLHMSYCFICESGQAKQEFGPLLGPVSFLRLLIRDYKHSLSLENENITECAGYLILVRSLVDCKYVTSEASRYCTSDFIVIRLAKREPTFIL